MVKLDSLQGGMLSTLTVKINKSYNIFIKLV